MEERKGAQVMLAALTVMLCLSIGASGVFRLREANVRREMAMQQQREMADVIAAMADIEVNLSKLLIASGARQSVCCWVKRRCWLSTWKAACPAWRSANRRRATR